MPTIELTPALREEYGKLFNSCLISQEKARMVEHIIENILGNQSRYQTVGEPFGAPWYVIAVIHNNESSLNFNTHLHNGDPLTARTIHFPPGRPKDGDPPFNWEDSAKDAIQMQGLDQWTNWSLAGTLYQLERYNGWGYRLYHPHVLSPYLWSGSNHYHCGQYIKDGVWSDTAVWQQCGAAVVLRRMVEKHQVEFSDQPYPAATAAPLVSRFSRVMPTRADEVTKTKELQYWLNTFPGIFLKVDGIPGDMTSETFKTVTGHFLPDDPRA
ncbi:MAG: hypothetical protein HQK55_05230 [Deltaproteobacteria bacterium]|nr:hypothetical protein [Deltaproteobacteria bacterium]